MEHYSEEQWFCYKNGRISPEISRAMEEHLAGCDHCLEVFLSQIGEEEVEYAGRLLPSDFTTQVMKRINYSKKVKPGGKGLAKERVKNTFIFYAAAAALTLVFAGSGVFQSFVEKGFSSPTLTLSTRIIHESKVDLDFSGKVVNKAALWIENFETQGRFEGEEK